MVRRLLFIAGSKLLNLLKVPHRLCMDLLSMLCAMIGRFGFLMSWVLRYTWLTIVVMDRWGRIILGTLALGVGMVRL